MGLDLFLSIAGNVLLFCLVFGMSATVDSNHLMEELKNRKALATGCFLQFVVMPFMGFIVVKTMDLSQATAITLLVVTSSPGGSYSNWLCSLFNADLALSITMTSISTLLSVVMLPLNLLLYVQWAYRGETTESDVVEIIDWPAIFMSLAIVILAILCGLLASQHFDSPTFHIRANKLGNIAGVILVLWSAVIANTGESKMWAREWQFYVGVSFPCIGGLIFANILTTYLELRKPERVTVAIECCIQNVGIAMSVAMSMFEQEELAEAMGVPFFYGCVEALVLSAYCIVAWKLGWTKAPKEAPFWNIIYHSYEVMESADPHPDTEMPKVTKDVENDDEEAFYYVEHPEKTENP